MFFDEGFDLVFDIGERPSCALSVSSFDAQLEKRGILCPQPLIVILPLCGGSGRGSLSVFFDEGSDLFFEFRGRPSCAKSRVVSHLDAQQEKG